MKIKGKFVSKKEAENFKIGEKYYREIEVIDKQEVNDKVLVKWKE